MSFLLATLLIGVGTAIVTALIVLVLRIHTGNALLLTGLAPLTAAALIMLRPMLVAGGAGTGPLLQTLGFTAMLAAACGYPVARWLGSRTP